MDDRTRIESLEREVASLSVTLERLLEWMKAFTAHAAVESTVPLVWSFIDESGRLIEGPQVMDYETAGHRAVALSQITNGNVCYGHGFPTTFDYVVRRRPG